MENQRIKSSSILKEKNLASTILEKYGFKNLPLKDTEWSKFQTPSGDTVFLRKGYFPVLDLKSAAALNTFADRRNELSSDRVLVAKVKRVSDQSWRDDVLQGVSYPLALNLISKGLSLRYASKSEVQDFLTHNPSLLVDEVVDLVFPMYKNRIFVIAYSGKPVFAYQLLSDNSIKSVTLTDFLCELTLNFMSALPSMAACNIELTVESLESPGNAAILNLSDKNILLPLFSYFQSDVPEKIIESYISAVLSTVRRSSEKVAHYEPSPPQSYKRKFTLPETKNLALIKFVAKSLNISYKTDGNKFTTFNCLGGVSFNGLGQCGETHPVSVRMCADKILTKQNLESFGVVAPVGWVYKKDELPTALSRISDFSQYVVKPANGAGGVGVSCDIKTREDFEKAWRHALDNDADEIIVEERFSGGEHRVMMVENSLVSITLRVPAHVVGDGKSTFKDLVRLKNLQREPNPNLSRYPLIIDHTVVDNILAQGYKVEDVIPKGVTVRLHNISNVGRGGDAVDLTDDVHLEWMKVFHNVWAACYFPRHFGFDLIAEDISRSPDKQRWCVIEANSLPALATPFFPGTGSSRNMPFSLLQRQSRIPADPATLTLRITSASVFSYLSKLRIPFKTSRKTISENENYIIVLESSSPQKSLIGFGESAPRSLFMTADPIEKVWDFFTRCIDFLSDREIVVSSHEECIRSIRGLIKELNSIADEIGGVTVPRAFRGSICGIEMALLDISAKWFGVSVSSLIGRQRLDIPVAAATLSAGKDFQTYQSRLRFQATRFSYWRVKLGRNFDESLRYVESLVRFRNELQSNVGVWFDCNERLGEENFRILISRLEEMSRGFDRPLKVIIEQPVPKDDISLLATLSKRAQSESTAKIEFYVMADESLMVAEDWAEIAKQGSVGAVNIKIAKIGGLLPALDLARVIYKSHPQVVVYFGGMIATSYLMSHAISELCRVVPRFDLLSSGRLANLSVDITNKPVEYVKDTTILVYSDSPGFGVDIVRDRLLSVSNRIYTRGQSSFFSLGQSGGLKAESGNPAAVTSSA